MKGVGDMESLIKIEMDLPLGSYHNLDERLQYAYMRLLEGISHMTSEIRLQLNDIQEILPLYYALCCDYPQTKLVWDYKGSTYSSAYVDKSGREIILHARYHGSYECIKKKLQNIERETERILEICMYGDKITDDDIIRRVCAYLAKVYHYTEDTNNGDYPEYAYTLECLVRGDGVCAGFAGALTYILRKLQIPVMTVSGEANGRYFGGHAWNIIQRADGTYWHIDLTWNLGCTLEEGKYFELDDGAMRARNHYWNSREYPMCG